MSQYKPFFLRDQRIKNNCLDLIKELPTDDKKPLVIKIQPMTRNLEQNAKLHAMLSDISKNATWNGEKLDIYAWKNLLVSAHSIATGEPLKIVRGIEGELVNIRERTSKMSSKRLSSLIDYILAFCAGSGIEIKDLT
ncbi:recombination protein NinB [Aggregatibacter actinomycetemcomitans]|uniref:recombination protein NinB n=1 Tax=Aggregatibacter actinomycetemcomitans TaxID=714 RepID=UPI001E654B70|nr:recombination protein NinB [Aggregatibacter actinomycetemcomitans]